MIIYPFHKTQESPEVFLSRLSSKMLFKQAKTLLADGCRLCGSFDELTQTVTALFKLEKEGVLATVETHATADSAHYKCSFCGEGQGLCPHAFAALLYHYKHEYAKTQENNVEDPNAFRGLKEQSLLSLAKQANLKGDLNYIIIEINGEFPHIPSKWERASLTLSLVSGEKKYRGNLLNLRQLHFEKYLMQMKLEDLSLQERQIIRYLAINAEGETATLHLGAEHTAEFLHCLIGFPRFFRNGQRIIVHPMPAVPAIITAPKRGGGVHLVSAIRVNGTLISLDAVKVITGRNGVWVGIRGEYYWINGIYDVAWLRAFFRHGTQDVETAEAICILKEFKASDIEIVEQRRLPHPKEVAGLILLEGQLLEEGVFVLEVNFAYDGGIFPADQARHFVSNGKMNLRENHLEVDFIDALRYFGFEQGTLSSSIFTLKNRDVAIYFIFNFLPTLLEKFPQIRLSPHLLALRQTFDVYPRFVMKRYDMESVYLEGGFYLKSGQLIASPWKDVADHLMMATSVFRADDGSLSRVSIEMSKFIHQMKSIVAAVKGQDLQIRIARANVPYWVAKAGEMYGFLPPELLILNHQLTSLDDDESLHQIQTKQHEFIGSLRPYQKQGVQWLQRRFSQHFNVVLADEMGLGKTVQTLAFMAKTGCLVDRPHLIVCPTSLTENWRREAQRFVPTMKVEVLDQQRDKKFETLKSCDLVIVSYAVLRRELKRLQSLHFTLIVLDEAQHIKNPSTANAKSCKSIHAAYKLVLTGTPLENTPQDLWSIFDFLQPQLLGSLSAFTEQYFLKNQTISLDLLAERIAPFMLRRRKRDVCTELPAKTEQVLYCQMQEDQRALYNELLESGRQACATAIAKQSKYATFDILAQLLRLRQVCCDPALLPSHMLHGTVSSAKTDLLFELLEETLDSGHRVLLFSQFTSLLAIIRARLDAEKIPYCYLDGETQARQAEVDRFNQSTDVSLFLLSLKAGGTGLNLTSADTIILFDPWWNPAVENQAADRAHRIGQENPVNVIRLVAEDSIEERILKLQEKKQLLFNELVEDPSQNPNLQKLAFSDLQQLFN